MAEWKSRNAELECTVLPLEWQSYTPTSDNDDVDAVTMLMMTMLMMMMLMTMFMVNRQNKLKTNNVKCTYYILKMDVHITMIFLVQDPSGY